MAKQIEGVYDRVLECAKKEFLEKGYKDASLRTIAKEADTSTGSIYTRFKDKDGLFGAVVEPVVSQVEGIVNDIENEFSSRDAKTQADTMTDYSMESHAEIIDYIYDNKEIFRLLLSKAHGSSYEHFIDRLVELEENSTIDFLKTMGCGSILEKPVSREFIHILSTSYCYGMFEPLLHDMTRERAHEFDMMFTKYHIAGFTSIVEGQKI